MPVVPQALTAVGAQCFQDAVAGPVGAAAHHHHRLVDQTGQQLERVVLGGAVRSPHTPCAASRSNPPANTDSRVNNDCSGSVSSR